MAETEVHAVPDKALAKATIAAALIQRGGCLPDFASLDALASAPDFDWRKVREMVSLNRVTNAIYRAATDFDIKMKS